MPSGCVDGAITTGIKNRLDFAQPVFDSMKIPLFCLAGPFQIQRQQLFQNLFIAQLGRPAVGGKDGSGEEKPQMPKLPLWLNT